MHVAFLTTFVLFPELQGFMLAPYMMAFLLKKQRKKMTATTVYLCLLGGILFRHDNFMYFCLPILKIVDVPLSIFLYLFLQFLKFKGL